MNKKPFSNELKWLDENTFELSLIIKEKQIKEEYQRIIADLRSKIQIDGFRKGKVPFEIVEKQIGKEKIYQQVIQNLLPKAYLETIKKYNLQPIVNPKFNLINVKEGKNWLIKATSCQKPKVKLGDYKSRIKAINTQAKMLDAGKRRKKTKSKDTLEKEEQIQKIIQVLLETVTIKIPQMVIEEELNRKLANLIDELQKVGLTVEAYASSKNKTVQEIIQEYRQQIENNLKIDSILNQIAEEEKITVSPKEAEKIAATSTKNRINPYLATYLVRQRKTIEYLINL